MAPKLESKESLFLVPWKPTEVQEKIERLEASGYPVACRTFDQAVVRKAGLPIGLVDHKIASIDKTWPGLRFVWRK